jgi:hypothetical protein
LHLNGPRGDVTLYQQIKKTFAMKKLGTLMAAAMILVGTAAFANTTHTTTAKAKTSVAANAKQEPAKKKTGKKHHKKHHKKAGATAAKKA